MTDMPKQIQECHDKWDTFDYRVKMLYIAMREVTAVFKREMISLGDTMLRVGDSVRRFGKAWKDSERKR